MRTTILLDLYGTLVEPDWPALLTGRTSIAEQAGLPVDAAHRAWDGTHAARMIGMYGSLDDDLAAIFAKASGGAWSSTSSTLLSQLADEERENWRLAVRLCDDALPTLTMLRSFGLQVAIVTNASAEAMTVIDTLGLRRHVDDVFASCQWKLLKPDLLEAALRSLGARASEATMVDDELAELDRGASLGIDTILIRRSTTHEPAAAAAVGGPHRLISDLREVADLVRSTLPLPR